MKRTVIALLVLIAFSQTSFAESIVCGAICEFPGSDPKADLLRLESPTSDILLDIYNLQQRCLRKGTVRSMQELVFENGDWKISKPGKCQESYEQVQKVLAKVTCSAYCKKPIGSVTPSEEMKAEGIIPAEAALELLANCELGGGFIGAMYDADGSVNRCDKELRRIVDGRAHYRYLSNEAKAKDKMNHHQIDRDGEATR